MDDLRIKSLEEFSEESDKFEELFLQFDDEHADETARRELVDRIVAWLQDSAKQGRFIPSASADRRAFRSMLERWSFRLRGMTDSKGIDRLANFDPEAGVVLDCPCPYPGLDPYGEGQRRTFFGREKLISSVVDHLGQQGNRTFMIVGASGSGKSSAALAGILPRLEERHSSNWLFATTITPGSQPLLGLSVSVAQVIDRKEEAKNIAVNLAAAPDKSFELVADLCEGKPLVLLIDQFEELFTLCQDAKRRSGFSKVLCDLSDPAKSTGSFACKILLTLRTDQQARFEESEDLFPLYSRILGDNNEHLRNLSAIGFDDIKRGIKKPAEEVGLRFIPAGLIDQLASQTAGLANGLPLLQFSLRRLWRMRPKNEEGKALDLITEKMVSELPDVERALGKVADDIFQNFTEVQQKLCERLFLELIVLDERYEEPLRRRRKERELNQAMSSLPGTVEDRAKVIESFGHEGLLRRFGDEESNQIEVAHEALLRHWKHIYNLLMGAEVKERLHHIKQVRKQAFYWTIHHESKDYLNLRGEPLQRACQYGDEHWLVEEETTAYVASCVKEEKRTKTVESREKMLRNFSLSLIIVSAAVWFFLYTNKQANDAEIARQAADSISKGQYQMLIGDLKKAEKHYMQAQDLADGFNRGAQLGLGLVYLQSTESGSDEKAVKYFEDIITMSNEESEQNEELSESPFYAYYFHKGTSLRSLGKHKEAISDFNQAIKLLEARKYKTQQLGIYYFSLGETYFELWKVRKAEEQHNLLLEAEKAFRRAITILEDEGEGDQKLSDYYFNMGRTYLALNEIGEAIDFFNKGIDYHRRSEADHRSKIGREYLESGEIDAAISQFEQTVQMVNDEPRYYNNLSEAIVESRQLEAASLGYPAPQQQAVLSDRLTNVDELVNSGEGYLRAGDPEQARREFQQAIDLSAPTDEELPSYKVMLAQANLMLGKYTEAEELCTESVVGDVPMPKKESAYLCLGNALSAQSKYGDAIKAYQNAFSINQQSATTVLYLADVYAKSGDHEKGRELLRQAEELSKSDIQFQVPEAKEFFNRSLESVKNYLERS